MNSVVEREDIQGRINEIGQADILVGVPSYNNARSIGHVVRAVQAGPAKYFTDRQTVLVNSDGGSTDGTLDAVHTTTIDAFHSILLSHRAAPLS